MADHSLVVVNYRSAALCRAAVASARSASSAPLEVVVVDNSCDPAEAAALEAAGADRLVISPTNAGYAGGANAGIRASSGARIVVANPDVVFGDGCVDRLLDALGGRVALAGPRFSWDAAGEWLIPPAAVLTFAGTLAASMARLAPALGAARGRSRFRERVAFWRATEPARVAAVSGAVMAIDRDAWSRVGGFDERFPLYYEEIDFMRELGRLRYEIVHVPSARCRHIYDQSAASAPEQQAKFAESEARYLAKWHPAGARLLRVLRRRGEPVAPVAEALAPAAPIEVRDPERSVIEASPLESFETAAGHFPRATRTRFPAEVWQAFHGSALYVRVVDASTGRELWRGVMRKSA